MLAVSKGATEDTRYLLSRGYSRESVVRLVGDKYVLGKPQRLLLFRCAYPPDMAKAHWAKLVPPGSLGGAKLAVDGYNVLWTIDSTLRGRPIFQSDDGFIRDISIEKGEPTVEALSEAANLAVSAIAKLKPGFAHFLFDRPISRSGEVSKLVNELLEAELVNGVASTSNSVDSDVVKIGDIVATSDSVIVERASQVFDLGGYVIRRCLQIKPTKI